MSLAPGTASGVVRVTVASGTRRVDLVLPAAVPVAELVPELARSVGLLDAATVHGGYRVVTHGRALAVDAGLMVQGVEDGELLTVTSGVDDEPPRVYDDVVEAMSDAVEHEFGPWEPASGRRTALTAAALLLGLGAVALLVQWGELFPAAAAAAIATLLITGGLALSRVQQEREAAVLVSGMAAVYAAVAGLMLLQAPRVELFGLPVAGAGAGALLVGLIAMVGLDEGRTLVIPAVVVGGTMLASGLTVSLAELDAPAVVFTVALVLVVAAGSALPWLALGATGTRVGQVLTAGDLTNDPEVIDPEVIDPERVRADARTAHDILVAVSATVGLLLVLVVPLAVSLGLWGTLVAVVCCLVVMLRTRQYRTGTEVLVGLVSGVMGLVSVAVSVLWLHESWRPWAAVALAGTAAVLLAATLIPGDPSVLRARLGDVAESVALLALPPLLLLSTGIVDALRG